MNKNAIKKFAIEARKKLMASVSDRAGMIGITPEGCGEPISKGIDFEVYKTVAGTEVTLGRTQCEQRRKLKEQIEVRGFEAVVEEVAYTWFNRICAIRFMEVNDYLPTRVRVLSSEKEGKNEPDIVTQAPDVDLDFTDKEREYILDCKMNNKLDELFKMLFIKQCNKLSDILPELFEATEDYTEMLLNISYTNKDDVISMLVNPDTGIPEADFNVSTTGEDGQPTGQVEIIGWLYQYYNTELKDDTFAQLKKNVKISKERIPAATQLFTPDWIVRYMVENSVGRIWIEHLRTVDSSVNEKEVAERFGWKYYLPEAEQEADVNVKLAEIRTSYKDLKPEEITCIDPCMGSGHILVAMFDVLMDIYKSAGYSERDAAIEIVKNNIHGIDIDKRAYQLAYFAVMMKGRGYNRRFFKDIQREAPTPQLYSMCESNDINDLHLKFFGSSVDEIEKNNAYNQICGVLEDLRDAREYGSILQVDNYEWDLLRRYVSGYSMPNQISFETMGIEETQNRLMCLINIGQLLSKRYDAVVTNPPYMGANSMGKKLSDYTKKHYPTSKSDLFAVFMERCGYMLNEIGYQAMITQHAWMFLSSLEKLRNITLLKQIQSIVHLGTRAFEEIGGEVVQTAAFVVKKKRIANFKPTFIRLVDFLSASEKQKEYFKVSNKYCISQEVFDKIPGKQLAYWLDMNVFDLFEKDTIGDSSTACYGFITGNNDKYMRLWHEINIENISFDEIDNDEFIGKKIEYVPCNKGGSFRKWYGNNSFVVNWRKSNEFHRMGSTYQDAFFKKGITWSVLSSNMFNGRYYPNGFVFDHAAASLFVEDEMKMKYILGYMNSCVFDALLNAINPTINSGADVVSLIPLVYEPDAEVIKRVEENICISHMDWSIYETSWEFTKNPLVRIYQEHVGEDISLRKCFELWQKQCESAVEQLRTNEEYINNFFTKLYHMEGMVDIEVDDDAITLHRANEIEDIKMLISYVIGCLFGRYAPEQDGVMYAGGKWCDDKYLSIHPNKDNVIPITDEEYLDDDIVSMFDNAIGNIFGEHKKEENLLFISECLNIAGKSPREIIRKYFVNEFYKDHCSMYSATGSGKRPIYWQFDAGKENGFKCLIYSHRYNETLVATIRTEYLHIIQKSLEQAIDSAEYMKNNATRGTEVANATKAISKYTKQLLELRMYDMAIAHIANQRVVINVDDGIKANYPKFQGVEVAQEGKRTIKVDLLSSLK